MWRDLLNEKMEELMKVTDVDVEMEVNEFNYLELIALAELLVSSGVEKVYSPVFKNGTVNYEEGLRIPKWRFKRLRGGRNVIVNVMPYLVDAPQKLSVWFQSPHPQGGVPDLMVSIGWNVSLSEDVIAFGEPAWEIISQGNAVELRGLWWKPDLVIEVKKSARETRLYPAKRRLMVALFKREIRGWEVIGFETFSKRANQILIELLYAY